MNVSVGVCIMAILTMWITLLQSLPCMTTGVTMNVSVDVCIILIVTKWITLLQSPSYISRVSNQNDVSLLYIMLEIHHSGWEPSMCR